MNLNDHPSTFSDQLQQYRRALRSWAAELELARLEIDQLIESATDVLPAKELEILTEDMLWLGIDDEDNDSNHFFH